MEVKSFINIHGEMNEFDKIFRIICFSK